MTQHTLQGRSEDEVLWFKRRDFLQSAAAWLALGGAGAAQAQARSNVVSSAGDVLVNGKKLLTGQPITAGDAIATGTKSNLVVVMGSSAFQVRPNTKLVFDGAVSTQIVNTLRLINGAVVSVWGKGDARSIVTPTLVAGIRGTGVYTEVLAEQDNRSYFCTCYGTVELTAGQDKIVSTADHHAAFWGEASPKAGKSLTPGNMLNHTDDELEYLAQLVGQKTAWQLPTYRPSKEVDTSY
jgi:hypothetical protein